MLKGQIKMLEEEKVVRIVVPPHSDIPICDISKFAKVVHGISQRVTMLEKLSKNSQI